MTTKTAWAALITRLPAADDLPLTTLLDLIETSQADIEARTGTEIAHDLTPGEQARCHAAAALSQVQPRLKNSAGHNACQAWASHRVTAARQVYQRHARDVLTEIAANPFTYLRNHPPSKPDPPTPQTTKPPPEGDPAAA
ncbi:hypothetical protein J7I84_05225 [Arthrobacter sp. ISL-85]|uniref:hypothetical protein n=1 Tax=Arthrobacter sp. ISL-85 TaxID=2819115 RepID=UPI001BE8C9A8|nr:hypothetical protein [Arthrobacter sp. ISL-85]MBT2565906.1 hypothetical protein [Arthrobacter sp. ISL-85]